EVSCLRNYLELCYKTPSHPPYNVLSSHLINQRAIAFVSDSRINLNYRPECALTPVSAERLLERQRAVILNHTRIWCIQLDWRKQVENPPCGLRVTEYMTVTGSRAKESLRLSVNKLARPNVEIQIRPTCTDGVWVAPLPNMLIVGLFAVLGSWIANVSSPTESGHLYSGYLNIVINPEYAKTIENLFFRFTCKTNNEIPQQVPGQIFEQ
ncbi:hypothetical protein T265_12886, partial [Opisthorchis viverrini]